MKAATSQDWPDLKPMPPDHIVENLGLTFDSRQMHNLRLGLVPVDQNQKWFLYFESDTLHMHRSWTGLKMFEVVFEADGEGAIARFARINLDQDKYGGTLDEAREMLLNVLRYFATDEAHEPYESGFLIAMKEATQPNYLGSPTVVMELVAPYFWRILCKDLPRYFSELESMPGYEPTGYNDVLTINKHITAVLCGDNADFHGLESWRTERGLGQAIISHLDLDPNWCADENLHFIVTEGLASISLQLSQIITDWAKEEPPLDIAALMKIIGIFREFTVSILLGTHTVHFPNVTLSDFTWENHSQFVKLDEDDEGNSEDEVECEEETEEDCGKQGQSTSFEQLVRELRAMEEEDHNPEDDEDFEEDSDDEEILLPGPPVHPRLDDKGNLVKLNHPSTPTAQWTWQAADSVAVVIPDGPTPAALAGIRFSSWQNVPVNGEVWEELAQLNLVDEPSFKLPKGKKAAAGVVVREEDGRIWAVAPSNAFGGYPVTFPKGTQDPGMSLQATAIREAFEEAGLQVELTRFLIDVPRSTSFTRYYLARRKGGDPADMGWESQAVMLLPVDALPEKLTNKNDLSIIQALLKQMR